jgi:glycosyltransferase involved in cell wall biosynthesis
MPSLRIAYILNIFPKISETFIAGELAELRRRGVELRILSLLPPRAELQHDIIWRAGLANITSYDVPAFGEIIKEFHPDLFHAHFAKEAAQKARELSLEYDVPFSFTTHGYDIYRKPPPDFCERAMAACAVITVSQSNAAFMQRTFGLPRSHIHVIPCGVDTNEFVPRKDGPSPQPPRIVCVARQVEVKNLALLLEACALLQQRNVSFRCLMLGDGPMRKELLAKRKDLGLEALIDMPGAASQEQVLHAWQAAAVGVLTSHNEGMPVCLMEAASCGVPVVATRVGGVSEMVDHGVTGLLCDPGNAVDLSDKLEWLLSDSPLRRRMGLVARAQAMKKFSIARQADALLDVWSRSLKEAAA